MAPSQSPLGILFSYLWGLQLCNLIDPKSLPDGKYIVHDAEKSLRMRISSPCRSAKASSSKWMVICEAFSLVRALLIICRTLVFCVPILVPRLQETACETHGKDQWQHL